MTDEEKSYVDVADPGIDEEEEAYTRSRRRLVLAAIVALLALLLGLVGFFVVSLISPIGLAKIGDFGGSYQWVRSIYGWGSAQTQQFKSPTDTAIGPDGTIWGTHPAAAMVIGFTPTGQFKSLIHIGPNRMRPEGIAVSEKNEIYVADFQYQRILVFSPAGRLLRKWDVPLPNEVAVRNGRVVVASRYGLAVFDEKGNLLKIIGSMGKGPQQFDTPHGVAIAANGDIYASDTQNARVKAYDSKGNLLWIFPADRAQALGARSKANTKIKGPFDIPSGLTLDGKGRIVLVDPFKFTIDVLDPAQKGKLIATYGGQGQRDGVFAYPTGISYDSARDYFSVADTFNDRLQVVRLPGSASNAALPLLRSLLDGPVWICSIPLALLLLAVGLAIWRRRRYAAGDDEDEEPPTHA